MSRSAMVAVAGLLVGASALVATNGSVDEQARAAAAKQLALQSPTALSTPTPTVALTPSISPTPRLTPTPSTTPTTPPPLATVVYPIKGFDWPAAGVKVSVVTMPRATWQSQPEGVDPQLDANGFDSVGHWLEGTGPDGPGLESGGQVKTQSIILAAHTCYATNDPLCNDTTFPFSRLSYGGWAVGQQASLTDSGGHVFDMTLVRRELVDKSGFGIDNNPCEVQVFSCNKQDPHNRATLVTFRRTQCKA